MKPVSQKTGCAEAVRIQERLDIKGVTWAHLGNGLDVTDQRLYYWRKHGVAKQYLAPLADYLDCSIDWLLTGRSDTPDEENDKAFLANLAETEKLTATEWHVLRTMAESLMQRTA